MQPGFTDVSSSPEHYLLFTDYAVKSAVRQSEVCATDSSTRSLRTLYSVVKPATATAEIERKGIDIR